MVSRTNRTVTRRQALQAAHARTHVARIERTQPGEPTARRITQRDDPGGTDARMEYALARLIRDGLAQVDDDMTIMLTPQGRRELQVLT
jgi:hypothetical protein